MHEPLFLLASSRSRGSLICAMLGRHPECFGFPQLNLFVADTLGEAWRLVAADAHGRDGLLRALAQANDGVQDDDAIRAAERWVAEHRDWPVGRVFEHLRSQVAPRMAVEFSASTVRRFETIERLLRNYPRASYLHVTRDPRAIARDGNSGLDSSWGDEQQNALDVAEVLPLGQVMTLRCEDVLAAPEVYLRQVALWLGIDAAPAAIAAMLHPEAWPFAGPGPAAAPFGSEADFHAQPVLDLDRAGAQAGVAQPAVAQTFAKPTQKLSRQLGYY